MKNRLVMLGSFANYDTRESGCPAIQITEETRRMIELFFICHDEYLGMGAPSYICKLSVKERLNTAYRTLKAFEVIKNELLAIFAEDQKTDPSPGTDTPPKPPQP